MQLLFLHECVYFSHQHKQKTSRYPHSGPLDVYKRQGEDVAKMMEKAGFTEVTVKKDLAGLDRVVSGMYNR